MIFCDTEYNDRGVILAVFYNDAADAWTEIDCRHGQGRAELAAYVEAHRGETWAAYAAMAEMSSMLRLGVSPRGLDWVDLRAEAVMITGTHPGFACHHPGLLDHLRVFGLEAPEEDKAAMRDLILGQDAWSPEEWADIVRYCRSDVAALPGLWAGIQLFHAEFPTVWRIEHALQRGDYLIASALLEHRSRGLPIDEPFLRGIFSNKRAIQNALAEECNLHYGHQIYAKRLDTLEKLPDGSRRASIRYSLSHDGLEAYLKSLEFPPPWERTPSGRLSLADDYLDKLIQDQPSLVKFRYTRAMLSQLNSDGLIERIEPGSYVRPVSLPFYTKTSRNQPLAAKGFLLNLPPWLRHAIRPHPGRVIVACDWSQQEIAIGAALSGDEDLLAAFRTGDLYLALGKMAGAIPADGSKKSHPIERQAYKSVQLGLGYGMKVQGLAKKLYADLNGEDRPPVSRAQAEAKAAEIYAWHRLTFARYWAFLDGEVRDAMRKGYTTSGDAWFYFTEGARENQLLNLPAQSNGAFMLREAMKILAFETDLTIVCSLHDAIYAECAEEDADRVAALMQDAMSRAAERVIGSAIRIEVEPKVYTHPTGYTDERGTETLARIKALLADMESQEPILVETIPPKARAKRKSKAAGSEEYGPQGARDAIPGDVGDAARRF